ncbi:hypothetical protein CSUI_004948 [Cystoisospora suis]|uniref:Transmembrane protein n=1 Tax=Cystoisospora suis TaxID=483139 RepID=A0A2C6KVG6_9APIC|nr:hypothetical protein CSUI_004948 [Cystoisospora suis]
MSSIVTGRPPPYVPLSLSRSLFIYICLFVFNLSVFIFTLSVSFLSLCFFNLSIFNLCIFNFSMNVFYEFIYRFVISFEKSISFSSPLDGTTPLPPTSTTPTSLSSFSFSLSSASCSSFLCLCSSSFFLSFSYSLLFVRRGGGEESRPTQTDRPA